MFSCFLCQGCVCQTGIRPCRSEELPCAAGWSPSLPVLWWTSLARPGNVSQWNRTTKTEYQLIREERLDLARSKAVFSSLLEHNLIQECQKSFFFTVKTLKFSRVGRCDQSTSCASRAETGSHSSQAARRIQGPRFHCPTHLVLVSATKQTCDNH